MSDNTPIHYVSSDEQGKDNGESACGTTNWLIGTTDESAVNCPLCLAKIAEETGYNDALYDGIDTSSTLPCRCDDCITRYLVGWDKGLAQMDADMRKAEA
jgi:hypothetical protein